MNNTVNSNELDKNFDNTSPAQSMSQSTAQLIEE